MLKFIFKSFSNLEIRADGTVAICAATILGLAALVVILVLALHGVPPIV